jgi:hypothetical protein
MWISFSQSSPEPPPILTDEIEIERVNTVKPLGVWMQNDLKWNTHVRKITKMRINYYSFFENVGNPPYHPVLGC